MQTHNHFDIIIAGAGLAGLTLAVELARRPQFFGKKILLLDRDSKKSNDRTWCFWAAPDEPLPPCLHKTWHHFQFFGENFEQRLDTAPYLYYMVRGIEFYQFADEVLAERPNFSRLRANIFSIENEAGVVKTSVGDFSADLIFNSLPPLNPSPTPLQKGTGFQNPTKLVDNQPFNSEQKSPSPFGEGLGWGKSSLLERGENSTWLLQHFKGWVIETDSEMFDPQTIHFMDFRIAQHGETRFFYVLPITENRALVEFTVFSPALLPAEEYVFELKNYLSKFLKINDFRVVEEEFGVIPMTDFEFPSEQVGRTIFIGTAGGFVKGSSGYAFKRTQRKIHLLVEDWLKNGQPNPKIMRSPARFLWYDRIFLRVFRDRTVPPRRIFTQLFRGQSAREVFRFLDEDSTFVREPATLLSAPFFPFLKAFFKIFLKIK